MLLFCTRPVCGWLCFCAIDMNRLLFLIYRRKMKPEPCIYQLRRTLLGCQCRTLHEKAGGEDEALTFKDE
jgi:hypothetical protein